MRSLICVHERGIHASEVVAALTYSYRGQDEHMEENGNTKDREEKRMKRTDKNVQDIFVHHVDRVSKMMFIVMPYSLQNM